MKRFFFAALAVVTLSTIGWSDNDMPGSSGGRYQMYTNPHANRMYVLDTQTGRVFQLANYKDVGREILEEVPYVYGSTRLCTPAEYERSPERCFTRNFDYMKSLMNMKREQEVPPADATPAPASDAKPAKKP